MTDFEHALRQAIQLSFPGARVKGCYYHYTQALWRKVQTLGLQVEYSENKKCLKSTYPVRCRRSANYS